MSLESRSGELRKIAADLKSGKIVFALGNAYPDYALGKEVAVMVGDLIESALSETQAPVRQIDKRVVLQASEYAQLVYNARRYEWLRDNMRRMPMGEAGQRHFFDQPGTMSFQEAVDVAMEEKHAEER